MILNTDVSFNRYADLKTIARKAKTHPRLNKKKHA